MEVREEEECHDDNAIDIVTFRKVKTDTCGGPVKKRVEVPIRPIAGSQAGPSSQPLLATACQSEDFSVAMSDMFDDVLMHEPSKNKVVETHICGDDALIQGFQWQLWMQELIDHAEVLLAALLAQEALPNDGLCTQVLGRKQAVWRCKDCMLSPLLCQSCMHHSHLNNHLHQIESWTGSFFCSAGLWEVRVYLLVQHIVKEVPCTSLDWGKEMLERLQLSKDDKEQCRLSTASGRLVPTAPHANNIPASAGLSIEDWEDNNKEGDQDNSSEDDVAMLDSIHGYLGDANANANAGASAWASVAAHTLLSPNTP
jgi:Putative zinc finger in N-recognin (UBR box)